MLDESRDLLRPFCSGKCLRQVFQSRVLKALSDKFQFGHIWKNNEYPPRASVRKKARKLTLSSIILRKISYLLLSLVISIITGIW